MTHSQITLFTSKTLKNGEHPIMMRLTKNGKLTYISTGFSSKIFDWNVKLQKPRRSHPQYENLVSIISNMENKIRKIIVELEIQSRNYSVAQVKSKYLGKGSTHSVFEMFEKRIQMDLDSGSIGNSKVYRQTLSSFKKFRSNRDIQFYELDYPVIKDYESFMQRAGLKKNTIAIRMGKIKAVYNLAVKHKVAKRENNPFLDYEIKREKTISRALTKDQIKKIEDYEPASNSEAWAKDVFLFSLYAQGMNFKDMLFLTDENIIEHDINSECQVRINYNRKKTSTYYDIGVGKKLEPILIRFMERCRDKNEKGTFYIVPLPNEKVRTDEGYKSALRWVNRLLQRIGKKLSLPIKLTTYVARHSYASIMYKENVNPGIISQALGHRSIKTTQIYLAQFDNKMIDQANKQVFG
jgi:site-specific recombinase XerD